MNESQRKTLIKLGETLIEATRNGLLDELGCDSNPDTVNEFCDAVIALSDAQCMYSTSRIRFFLN